MVAASVKLVIVVFVDCPCLHIFHSIKRRHCRVVHIRDIHWYTSKRCGINRRGCSYCHGSRFHILDCLDGARIGFGCLSFLFRSSFRLGSWVFRLPTSQKQSGRCYQLSDNLPLSCFFLGRFWLSAGLRQVRDTCNNLMQEVVMFVTRDRRFTAT